MKTVKLKCNRADLERLLGQQWGDMLPVVNRESRCLELVPVIDNAVMADDGSRERDIQTVLQALRVYATEAHWTTDGAGMRRVFREPGFGGARAQVALLSIDPDLSGESA